MSHRPSINRNQLKYLVIAAMLIDHIAWGFVPTASIPGQAMHFIGRLTGPTMAYFIAEGYAHTRSVRRYALRLALFALISWAPYCLYDYGVWPYPEQSVMYTLLLGLIAVLTWDKLPAPRWVKGLVVAGLCWLSRFGDWPYFDVLWPLGLFIYRDDPPRKWRWFWPIAAVAAVSMAGMHVIASPVWWSGLFQLGILVPPAILQFCYDGQPGSRHPFHKWFFYVFYPAHLLVLAAIKFAVR